MFYTQIMACTWMYLLCFIYSSTPESGVKALSWVAVSDTQLTACVKAGKTLASQDPPHLSAGTLSQK